MKDVLVPAAIATGLVAAAAVIAVIAGRCRLDEAEHGPPSFRERALLDAIERGDLHEGHYPEEGGQ